MIWKWSQSLQLLLVSPLIFRFHIRCISIVRSLYSLSRITIIIIIIIIIMSEGIKGLMGEKGLMEEDWNKRSNWRKKII